MRPYIVYCATVSAFSISTAYNGFTPTLVAFGVLYLTVLPRAYFPSLFNLVYMIYCSKRFGYQLRHMLHSRAPLPHSDFRPGIASLPRGNFGPDVLRNLPSCGAVVVPVPILADNYAYLILCCETNMATVVDPADPLRVIQMLDLINSETSSSFVLTDVLCSHKHWDHAGGNRELLAFAQGEQSSSIVSPDLKIHGSKIDHPDSCTNLVEGGDHLIVSGNLRVRILHSPGHTMGSVMFLLSADSPTPDVDLAPRTALFTGDCIFCGGCGAMFEVKSVGDVLQTYDLFYDEKVLGHSEFHTSVVCEDHVLVYVGHEYTERLFNELSNEAVKVEVHERSSYDLAVIEQSRAVKRRRSQISSDSHLPACTVPSTLGVERRTNPLLTLRRDVLSAHRGDGLESLIYASRARTNVK